MNRRAELASLLPERDNEGYLLDPATWSRAVAQLLAAEDGLVLTPAHWQVIDFIRAWYGDTESVPEARRVIQHLAEGGRDKRAAKQALYDLFTHGYGQQACRIAGMRKPLKLMLDV
ncbi:TusE/DsrC/DsvC family sulfur relay protein [Thiobacillus sp.]|uniref:TusE/DsrC/DsvC family sulfur relay protein n=1 Tax=Thiobacillus sp. TaxID=924 RepID=UPI0011D4D500|nr:TusE/DsrC/DsvC family sulfur relay protein [Thiobacillus sp.]MBD3811628.1 TusE/DsrC/DsvC family sulfur relay protein [Betaproteobacteria bacterium]MBC2730448.1 TusE/DsrC/DsvC family sulfur relay protein [Thiobacillus sp.]MBC2739186.1 TusE/DsrC/DsvC family sulfur relay protein [Thiobacillus sp.]MBC2760530.1 TusE/DsrC/DsvC family sulfur relay protein [Thiobacillus sp.]TXH75843.1 MAG: TusE/DsrC/DsvC family sulfur relay protein [Thiobacillus sp.]